MGGESDLWFKMYPGRWLTSSTIYEMTPAAEALYVRMLCYQAINGHVPNSFGTAKQIFGARFGRSFRRLWEEVIGAFVPHPDNPRWLINPTLHRELEEQTERIERYRAAGRKGGIAKAKLWHRHGIPLPSGGEGRGVNTPPKKAPKTTSHVPPVESHETDPPSLRAGGSSEEKINELYQDVADHLETPGPGMDL